MLSTLEDSLEVDDTLGRPGRRVEYRGTDGDAATEPPNAPPG